MNGIQLDDLRRSLSQPRRTILGVALAMVTGSLVVGGSDAKKKRKHKHKKRKKVQPPTPNEFGCLEVGDACASEDDCCSGICEGKKGKLTCQAHDTGTCEQGVPGYCQADNPFDTYCSGGTGVCVRTTAGSNACIYDRACADCRRDADCVALGYPPGSACAPWDGNPVCADIYPCENGMACVFPSPEA